MDTPWNLVSSSVVASFLCRLGTLLSEEFEQSVRFREQLWASGVNWLYQICNTFWRRCTLPVHRLLDIRYMHRSWGWDQSPDGCWQYARFSSNFGFPSPSPLKFQASSRQVLEDKAASLVKVPLQQLSELSPTLSCTQEVNNQLAPGFWGHDIVLGLYLGTSIPALSVWNQGGHGEPPGRVRTLVWHSNVKPVPVVQC